RMPQQEPPQAAQVPVQPPLPPEPVAEPEAEFEEQPEHEHAEAEVEEPRQQAFEPATMFTPMPSLDDGPPTMIHSPVPHEREAEQDAYDEPERSHALEPERAHALEPEQPPQESAPPALPWNVQVSTTPSAPPVPQAEPEPDEPVL